MTSWAGRQRKKEERAERRQQARLYFEYLTKDADLKVEFKNNDAHIIITKGKARIDYWPGADKFKFENKIYRGLDILEQSIQILKEIRNENRDN